MERFRLWLVGKGFKEWAWLVLSSLLSFLVLRVVWPNTRSPYAVLVGGFLIGVSFVGFMTSEYFEKQHTYGKQIADLAARAGELARQAKAKDQVIHDLTNIVHAYDADAAAAVASTPAYREATKG